MYPDRIVDKDLLPVLGCAGHTPIAVIVLTYNEEANIDQALNSVVNWALEIFVLDSFSADNTVEIAGQAGCTVVQNAFIDYMFHVLHRLTFQIDLAR